MAHKGAGNDEKAREHLAKANEWTDAVLAGKKSPPPWNRRETLKLLREEAEGVVDGGREETTKEEQQPENEAKNEAEAKQPAAG